MTKAILTRFPGVQIRPDSRRYQFVLRAPVDLLNHFPGGWAVRCSLGTADLEEANRKAKALHAEWAERFESLRSGKPKPVDVFELRRKLFSVWQKFVTKVDAGYADLPKPDREERAQSLDWQIGYLKQCLEDGVLPEWEEEAARRYGDPLSPIIVTEFGAHKLMMYEVMHETVTDERRTFPIRVAYIRARRELMDAQSEGALMVAAASSESGGKSKPANGKKISDAFEEWVAVKSPSDKTRLVFFRHSKQFADLLGDPWLSEVDKTAAISFRDQVQAWAVLQKKTATTADNVLVSVRALFNVARDKGWISANVMERLRIEVGGRESEGREPWTQEELVRLFDDPIWTSRQLPSDRKAGGEAAYWIPLIACYTGARQTEIAQLWTDDVSVDEGREVLEFTADGERDQKLKTAGSWRAVPMHSELIRLGLCEYVKSLPKGPLFPTLPKAGQNGAGAQFGQWFGTFKHAKGFTTPAKSFHSFRHLVATELRLAGATDAQADAITGHAGEGVGRKVYAATIRRQAERLRPIIELLRFPICGAKYE